MYAQPQVVDDDQQLPAIDFAPPSTDSSRHRIALIGCGNIAEMHLAAYRAQGLNVVRLCDRNPDKTARYQAEFYPAARIGTDPGDVFADPAVTVVDIATHVSGRPALIEEALRADKHVLSQKPFVLDIDVGQRLVDLAASRGRLLAVNHNGRWAPHFAALLAADRAGLLGELTSADFAVYWPQDQIVADVPALATMHDLVLYDFGTHWFDLIAQLAGDPHAVVYASTGPRPGSRITVPTQAEVLIEFSTGMRATIVFRASSERLESGGYRVEGTRGVAVHQGLSLGGESVQISSAGGSGTVAVDGEWWRSGMAGTMAELLRAIENGDQPANSALSSLPGLRLCFAALRSSRERRPIDAAGVSTPPAADA